MGTGTGVALLLPYLKTSNKQNEGQSQKEYEYMIISSEAWASNLSAD